MTSTDRPTFPTAIRVRLHRRYANAFTVATIRPSTVAYWPPVVLTESALIVDNHELGHCLVDDPGTACDSLDHERYEVRVGDEACTECGEVGQPWRELVGR